MAKNKVCMVSLLVTGLMSLSLLVSCRSKPDDVISETGNITSGQSAKPSKDAPVPGNDSGIVPSKITFRQAGGQPAFALQTKPGGAKLLDGSGQAIATLILEDDGAIRLSDPSNNVVGYVVTSAQSVQIKSPKRTKTLFSFTQSQDGDAVLTRNNGSTVYRLTATDNGYVVASDKATLYTVVANKGTGQLQTQDGQVIMTADNAIAPTALSIFGFDKLTEAQQAGLAYALTL